MDSLYRAKELACQRFQEASGGAHPAPYASAATAYGFRVKPGMTNKNKIIPDLIRDPGAQTIRTFARHL
ncbi:hypothetical protein [Inquilinus sp. CAU 1745]|uniref:hypothetical protein n=1 Tax=Inquilinus sp. CAU 1745 TaxID=3140369 RepID=UPI00325AF1F5